MSHQIGARRSPSTSVLLFQWMPIPSQRNKIVHVLSTENRYKVAALHLDAFVPMVGRVLSLRWRYGNPTYVPTYTPLIQFWDYIVQYPISRGAQYPRT
ncbi:uncharacterized protein ARMOST_17627 [Armillaria ostoyae]|uniref:Uncharacterized protein n=1 Tax=Armillaria ostoyae TaxID=47428 RepID=A0A284RZH7_ARMOS|nr:uncharacterized protein ARMOST_17627 [Armillaria ostoyae]